MLRYTLATLPFVATCAVAIPTLSTRTTTTTLNDRSTFQVLADGSSYQSGDITPNLRWQSSGVFSVGCSESVGIDDCYTMSLNSDGDLESTKSRRLQSRSTSSSSSSGIGDYHSWESIAAHDDADLEAYTSPWNALEQMYWQNSGGGGGFASTSVREGRNSGLRKRQDVKTCSSGGGGGNGSGDGGGSGEGGNGGGTPKPPAPRQRIEMFSWPGARSGETWSFSWKSHQGPTSITSKFFHTWQILRRDCGGGPIITLDLKGGKAVISDDMRGCIDCTSVDANLFVARTIQHELQVTFGLNGAINYRAYDVTPNGARNETGNGLGGGGGGYLGLNLASRPPVLTYQAFGDMGDQASLKFGQYRAVTSGLKDVTTFVGDYEAQQIS